MLRSLESECALGIEKSDLREDLVENLWKIVGGSMETFISMKQSDPLYVLPDYTFPVIQRPLEVFPGPGWAKSFVSWGEQWYLGWP